MKLELNYGDHYILWEALNHMTYSLKSDIRELSEASEVEDWMTDQLDYLNLKLVQCTEMMKKIEKSQKK